MPPVPKPTPSADVSDGERAAPQQERYAVSVERNIDGETIAPVAIEDECILVPIRPRDFSPICMKGRWSKTSIKLTLKCTSN